MTKQTLIAGAKAPSFVLSDKTGHRFDPEKAAADYTVIYFYPKDDTPGCTIEAKEFSDLLPQFKKLNTTVIGISGGDDKSKEKFCKKHDLSVLLLSDPDFEVAKSFGAYGKKQFMGKTFDGIFRKTFILDRNLNIIHVFEDVSAQGHAQEVLSFIEASKKN